MTLQLRLSSNYYYYNHIYYHNYNNYFRVQVFVIVGYYLSDVLREAP